MRRPAPAAATAAKSAPPGWPPDGVGPKRLTRLETPTSTKRTAAALPTRVPDSHGPPGPSPPASSCRKSSATASVVLPPNALPCGQSQTPQPKLTTRIGSPLERLESARRADAKTHAERGLRRRGFGLRKERRPRPESHQRHQVQGSCRSRDRPQRHLGKGAARSTVPPETGSGARSRGVATNPATTPQAKRRRIATENPATPQASGHVVRRAEGARGGPEKVVELGASGERRAEERRHPEEVEPGRGPQRVPRRPHGLEHDEAALRHEQPAQRVQQCPRVGKVAQPKAQRDRIERATELFDRSGIDRSATTVLSGSPAVPRRRFATASMPAAASAAVTFAPRRTRSSARRPVPAQASSTLSGRAGAAEVRGTAWLAAQRRQLASRPKVMIVLMRS